MAQGRSCTFCCSVKVRFTEELSMKRILISFFAGAMLAGVCMAQSAQSQASGSASQEPSASAGKSGAQAASSASAATSEAAKVSDKGTRAQGAAANQLQAG